jgi:hypothetical protein
MMMNEVISQIRLWVFHTVGLAAGNSTVYSACTTPGTPRIFCSTAALLGTSLAMICRPRRPDVDAHVLRQEAMMVTIREST